jgi:hypothetical protein
MATVKNVKLNKNESVEKYLNNAKIFATGFAAIYGTVTIDDVRMGYPPRSEKQTIALQTGSRNVFDRNLFEQTGETVLSSRPSARGARINVYRLA